MKKRKRTTGKDWVRYSTLGTEIMVTFALAVFGGLKMDTWLKTTPLFIISFITLAVVMVFVRIFRELNR